MYELTQVAGNSYYIQSPAKIGLVRLNDTDVCLIDSGNDKEAGRKVRQILDANGWHLTSIYNTHSNADHIGGNQYLQNQTGCRIYAPGARAVVSLRRLSAEGAAAQISHGQAQRRAGADPGVPAGGV